MQAVSTVFNRPPDHLLTAPSLELRGVSVHYGATPALEEIDVTLMPGDQVAVVGPNGAGKSTLFNVIAGIVKPDQGSVRIYGSGPSRHICVGYVPQRNRIDGKFPVTVGDVVMMGRVGKMGFLRWPSRADRARVDAALEKVSLAPLKGRQIGELSGGQLQRVFLARALAQEAELLLLDEPLTGLDAPSQEGLLAILHDLHIQGITTLIATHDLNEAADRFPLMWLLNRRLIAVGTPAAVLTPENLRAAYGSQVHVLRSENGELYLTDSCCGGGAPPVAHGLASHETAAGVLAPAPSVLQREARR